MIAALVALAKFFPELLALLKPLADALKDHGKERVKNEITNTFENLKQAKTEDEKKKALLGLDHADKL